MTSYTAKSRKNTHSGHQGFTMIEVLVALVVLSIGILGITALQVNAQKFSLDAYFRTQATVIAHDILERIRANPIAQQARSYHLPSAVKHSSCYSESGCGVDEMAENDMYEWAGNPVGTNSNSVARLLPGGSAVICIDSTPNDGEVSAPACDGSGNVYAAKVWWNQQNEEMHRVVTTAVFK